MAISVPITLAHHVFPKVSIVANPNYEASGEPANIPPLDSTLTVGEIDGGTNQFVIELYIKVEAGDNPRIPYSVDIVCAAQAVLVGDIPKDESPTRAMAEIGHRILFPAVRELILSLTARQPWGQFSIGLGVLGKPANPDPDSGKNAATAKPRPKPVHSKAPVKPPLGKTEVAAPIAASALPRQPRRIVARKKPPA